MFFSKKVLGFYQKQLIHRYDDPGNVFYYRHTDFEGLLAHPYTFHSNVGQTLRGAFYYRGQMRTDRVIIFCHGLGGGHHSYMKEIHCLASEGYTVLAYDNTGCFESEGAHIRGFAQSIVDLDFCIRSLRACEAYRSTNITVMGHSWGGMATLNIGAYHPDITHLVALSPPVSVKAMMGQIFHGLLRPYLGTVLRFEAEQNPHHAASDAYRALNSTEAQALIIHSADDPTVSAKAHFLPLKKACEGREGTKFLYLSGKKHNPNYTPDAIAYKDRFNADLNEGNKKGAFDTNEKKEAFKASYDFARMTAQDPEIWKEIFAFLENN